MDGPRTRVEGYFLVDTGGQVTSVDPEPIDWAGYDVRAGKRLSHLLGRGDSGSLGWVLQLHTFEGFGIRREGFEIHVHDQPREDGIDGLLGMDWLLRHVIHIDGPAGSIEVAR